jgi:hypothetical protein
MEAIETLTLEVGMKPVCEAFGVLWVSVYRLRAKQGSIRQGLIHVKKILSYHNLNI